MQLSAALQRWLFQALPESIEVFVFDRAHEPTADSPTKLDAWLLPGAPRPFLVALDGLDVADRSSAVRCAAEPQEDDMSSSQSQTSQGKSFERRRARAQVCEGQLGITSGHSHIQPALVVHEQQATVVVVEPDCLAVGSGASSKLRTSSIAAHRSWSCWGCRYALYCAVSWLAGDCRS